MTKTAKQLELWRLLSASNTTLAEGGGRSGKTIGIIDYIISRALRFPGTDHLIVRLAFNHAKLSIGMQSMQQLGKIRGVNYDRYLNKSDWIYTFDNGSRIFIGGTDQKERIEKILGTEYATIYFNEVSQFPYDTIETLITRLNPPQNVPAKIIMDLNPNSKSGWVYKIFHERKFPDGRKVPEGDYKRILMNPADNLKNISKHYLNFLDTLSAAKRKRYKDGEYQDDGGTLWKRGWIQYDNAEKRYQRIVIGVDPSGSVDGDEVGIVAAGKHADRYYVLDDYSLNGTPAEWAAEVVNLYKKWKADCIVAESNFGGQMVSHTIQTVDNSVKVKLTHSSRGKMVRAEPISALYERGLVKHRTPFLNMEDELCSFDGTGKSPNRLDALVFAVAELSGTESGGVTIGRY